MSDQGGELVELTPWQVVRFPHFIGVRHVNGPWTCVFLAGSGFEIPLEKLGLKVELHANGIEILEGLGFVDE